MLLMEQFGLKLPVILAPMAGGPTTPALAAEICKAGGLGSIGAAYLSPAAILKEGLELRARGGHTFLVNLFAPARPIEVSPQSLEKAVLASAPFRAKLGLSPPEGFRPPFDEDFEAQFKAVLELKPAVLSLVFGAFTPAQIAACRANDIMPIGTATSAAEATQLEKSGAEAIILQGVEAGGHRGIFDPYQKDPNINTFNLLKEIRTHLPLIAAGGIMTGADIGAALDAGAEMAQLGSAFLLAEEAGTAPTYRQALRESNLPTTLTRSFSGRLARGLANEFAVAPLDPLPFPAQNKFTRDIRSASAKQNNPACLSLWAGTEYRKAKEASAAVILQSLREELVAYSLIVRR
jgi:nitronate monooxygenase